jgi:transglutaminase-like putative cysteine protease
MSASTYHRALGVVRYHVRHQTAYDYNSDVVHSQQLLHLIPRPAPYQECLEHDIEITPVTFLRHDELDAFGNPVTRVEFERPHRRLQVTTDMEVAVYPRPSMIPSDTLPWDRLATRFDHTGRAPGREDLEAARFRQESPYVRVKRMFADYAESCFPAGRPIMACALELMTKLHTELKYAPGATTIATPVTEVLDIRRGVCQDFAHLMIACLRSRGLPARYVSGYVRSLVGSAASHAWVAVYTPPFGWLELDPTNDCLVSTDHISIAWGRDFGDVSPLRGIILGGGRHNLSVDVQVKRADPPPSSH